MDPQGQSGKRAAGKKRFDPDFERAMVAAMCLHLKSIPPRLTVLGAIVAAVGLCLSSCATPPPGKPFADGPPQQAAADGQARTGEDPDAGFSYWDDDGGGNQEPDVADLSVELSITPSTALVGDRVRVTAWVRNQGALGAPATELDVVVSGPEGFFLELAQAEVVLKGLGGQLAWPGLLRKLDRRDPSFRD